MICNNQIIRSIHIFMILSYVNLCLACNLITSFQNTNKSQNLFCYHLICFSQGHKIQVAAIMVLFTCRINKKNITFVKTNFQLSVLLSNCWESAQKNIQEIYVKAWPRRLKINQYSISCKPFLKVQVVERTDSARAPVPTTTKFKFGEMPNSDNNNIDLHIFYGAVSSDENVA